MVLITTRIRDGGLGCLLPGRMDVTRLQVEDLAVGDLVCRWMLFPCFFGVAGGQATYKKIVRNEVWQDRKCNVSMQVKQKPSGLSPAFDLSIPRLRIYDKRQTTTVEIRASTLEVQKVGNKPIIPHIVLLRYSPRFDVLRKPGFLYAICALQVS